MNATISRFRQAWVDRRAASAPKKHVPFRRSTRLLAIYSAVFALLASPLLSVPLAWRSRAPVAVVATFALTLLCIGCFWVGLGGFHPKDDRRNTRFCLLYVTLLLSLSIGLLCCLGVQFACGELPDPPRIVLLAVLPVLLPVFIAPAMLTLLATPIFGMIAGIGQALLLTLQIALFAANQEDFTSDAILPFAATALFSALVASAAVPRTIQKQKVHKRTQLFKTATISTVAPVAGMVAGGLCMAIARPEAVIGKFTNNWSWAGIAAVLAVVALGSCLFQAGVVAALHSLFEHIFDFTSDITLQAFADFENPLLKRLSREAPGTRNHGINVATIATDAADEIGADAILVRVAAYYHDIGKLTKPGLFSENQLGGLNPHDSLPAKTSAIWLRTHVKDGIATAASNRLPRPIRKIIAEHHGTTLMVSFHHKALEEARAAGLPPESVEEGPYRYEGPRPSSRESGILMLADSAEAAVNSMPNPTPQSIEAKVAEIVRAKLLDGQFNDCPLSMADIERVRKSLTTSLIAIRHARVAYPAPDSKEAGSPAPAEPAP